MGQKTTPLGAVGRGLVAGAAGTAVMDLVWYSRYRRGGGKDGFVDWEFSGGIDSWEEAPAPAQVAKRVTEGFLQKEVPVDRAPMMNNAVHWSYGMLWGALYGIAAGSLRKAPATYGLILGPIVWSGAYAILPLAKLYEPMWRYDAKTLAKDLSAHVAYGVGTAGAFRLFLGK
ncbi:MAG: hypothetical protein WD602_01655 [Actinomycetota bacterium]